MIKLATNISLLALVGLLCACGDEQATAPASKIAVEPTITEEIVAATPTAIEPRTLADILATRDDAAQARFQFRHPQQTLEFFGIKPGMTVIEALPDSGWYSKILLPYLGKEGQLIGVDYALDMWQHFGGFATEEFIEKKQTWPVTWADEASQWRDEDSAQVSAHQYGSQPASIAGTVDAVLFIRALHNLARFQDKGAYLDNAIKESFGALKPGGIVGVVQHQAREDRPDEWADGSNGYLKQSKLIDAFTAQGFEFVAASDINANPKDQAVEGDFVWRLPPSWADSKDDPQRRAAMDAIGESNRMTLKFRKPL